MTRKASEKHEWTLKLWFQSNIKPLRYESTFVNQHRAKKSQLNGNAYNVEGANFFFAFSGILLRSIREDLAVCVPS